MANLSLKKALLLRSEFEKIMDKHNVTIINHSEFERIYIIEDSLILYSQIYKNETFSDDITKTFYYNFEIEELTYNEIGFKFNASEFARKMEVFLKVGYLKTVFCYTKFKGYARLYWCPDTETTAERINRLMPELRLRERYEKWEGYCYYFIIIEAESNIGEKAYAVAYTTTLPHRYVNKMCKSYIKNGRIGGDSIRACYSSKFSETLKSWKGVRRQERMEKHVKYCSIRKYFREKDDVWRHADQLVEAAYRGAFDQFEKSSFVKSINKWTTEEYVYKLIKKLYSTYNVIYQYRPFFLKSSIGGQMSYDVFISGLNVAVEYQGKQHFEPIEFFGGETAFQERKKRDAQKMKLSKQNGIKLVYINYWEDITPTLIKSRIESVD